MKTPTGKAKSWASRICWLVGLWVASVVTLVAIALVLRVVMNFAGLTA